MADWQKQIADWAASTRLVGGPVRFLLRDPATVGITLTRILVARPGRVLVVTADSSAAERLRAALPMYQQMVGDRRPIVFLPEVATIRRNQWLPENEAARCAGLNAAMATDGAAVFLASVTALLTSALSPSRFGEQSFTLRVGDTGRSPEGLARDLVALDYDNEFEVHAPGEFARRGGLLDVYSPLYEAPVRIEFFADTIESMRLFLPETQRSYEQTDELRIVPRGAIVEDADSAEPACVYDYFGPDTPLAVCEPVSVLEHLGRYGTEEAVSRWEGLLAATRDSFLLVTDVVEGTDAPDADPASVMRADCVSLGEELSPLLPELGKGAVLWHWQQLRDHLLRWRHQGYQLVAFTGGEGESQRLRELLTQDPKTADLPVALVERDLDTGLLIPPARVALLSQKELFGRQPDVGRRRKSRYRFDFAARDVIEFEEGCYAVHASHGICIFRGIRQIDVSGELREVMELEFDDEAKLYVPLPQAHLVSRYVGGTKKLPRVSRLGGTSWLSAKESAEGAAWDLAAELLRLEALRQNSRGVAFACEADWESSFAGSFAYTETEDQKQAIADVLADMASKQPMDRLLCGDVGYGKTEVAMRAAFRTVLNGKQVAVMVPTTVLAQQHYATFRERMAEYPVDTEMISRFRTTAEQRSILEKLCTGQTDIVIGTHRLLQKDVVFNDLGLLIIDEEQRFGVRHKQRLKQMRASVDILTMTATPIPRTLYFSLSGLRHLSTIMTAPAERLPITTVVAQYDEVLIRQVLVRELERRGQAFFLHNRVQTIDKVCAHLTRLVPEARFAVAHGQMPSRGLEAVMRQFMLGEVDVLVCTTIIESGLDIPNANTIIIDRSDRFGLADLYQLRGRVGRYHRQAYAYLLLPPMGSLPSNARQRLAAIRRYTHLGAGFKLALRDLEIRGAGNILGMEQSGHIAAVGFDLYCQLLKEAVARLEQTPVARRAVVPVYLDSLVFGLRDERGRAAAALPPSLIGDEAVRVESYKRLNELTAVEEVDEFAAEIEDRFGPLPDAALNLMQVARVRVQAQRAGIISVSVRERRMFLETSHGLVKDAWGKLPRLSSVDGATQLVELLVFVSALAKMRGERRA